MKNQMMTVQDDGYVEDYQPSFYIATKEFLLKKCKKLVNLTEIICPLKNLTSHKSP